ncbi:phosphotransferase [uncultured Pseudoteredinibacter sp.]|uniref:phosphotransferase n=1 Tax=uncultured Pseudoteredinibacter sp. TaxID=1641701 RepID=UPI00262573AB|nr:phosphotransferase [uncultured Pseudoteredinibacter sp.]
MSQDFHQGSARRDVLSKSQSMAILSSLPEPWRSMDFQIFPLVSESNHNYLLQLPEGYEAVQEPLVLRVPKRDEKVLGADQSLEFKLYRWAAKQGLSPELLWTNEGNGVLLTKYIQDEQPGEQSTEQSRGLVEAIASSLSKLHGTQPESLGFDVKTRCILEHISFYRRQLGSSVRSFCEANDLSDLDNIYEDVALTWSKLEFDKSLCHCDLHRDNILLKGGRSYFVDWEYVALSPAVLDIASLQQSYHWSPDLFDQFLDIYSVQTRSAVAKRYDSFKQQLPLARFLLAVQSLYWALLHYRSGHGVERAGPGRISVSYARALKAEINLLKY